MAANAAKDATAESSPPPSREATKPDLLTIAAITVVAAVIADFIHEALGHGGMCVATGGQPLVLSTVHFDCSPDTRLVAAGGTLANLIFGTLSWGAVRTVKQSAPWRYFFWLLMIFNLFDAGGYFLFSGIGNIGDWAAVVAGWQPAWAWRVGLAALGIVTYFFLFVPLSLRELRPFLGKDAKIRVRRARRLTLVPYLTAGVLSCVAGALNPVGPLLILISAAASSFGGHSGLAWMWNLLHNPRIPSSEFQMPEIESSRGWIISAVVLAIGFIAGLGPGVKLHSVQRVVALDNGFHRNTPSRKPTIPQRCATQKLSFFLGFVPRNALVASNISDCRQTESWELRDCCWLSDSRRVVGDVLKGRVKTIATYCCSSRAKARSDLFPLAAHEFSGERFRGCSHINQPNGPRIQTERTVNLFSRSFTIC